MDSSRSKPKNRRLPLHLAVALHYAPNQGQAPMVVASGKGLMADRIETLAKKHGVPVHQDSQLAELLSDVELHQPVPEELFEAVAKVLAFVWRVDRRTSSGGKAPS